jgi:peptidoglycan hydrolase-like protein with peptidoglycan-binding domain
MAGLKNHPGLWLRDDAAAAFDAYEDKYGRRTVNSAGRTVAEQQDAINRWNQGGTYNRPPYLYKPAMPATASEHVKGGGLAVDIGDYQTFRRNSEEFGFFWWGDSDPVHFEFRGWSGGGSPSGFSQTVANEQNWLNASRGEHLAVDGLKGPVTTDAYKRYQTFLRAYGYAGAIDGEWGPGTQEAHAKYYAEWNAPKPGVPTAGGVPSGLPWGGIQQMLKGAGYGYAGAIDGIAGVGTVSAFQRFLNASGFSAGGVDGQWGPNTGAAAQRWLKARWGYTGAIDNDFGGGTRAAWGRADAANAAAF